MQKIYAVARALAILAAIAAAFITIPNAAAILLVLGAIAGVGNSAEQTSRLFLVTIVLTVGSKSLEAIPGAGSYLSVIFSGIGTVTFGASITGIVLGIYRRILSDWTGKAS